MDEGNTEFGTGLPLFKYLMLLFRDLALACIYIYIKREI